MAARYVTYDIFEEYKELTDRRVRSLLDMSLENLRRELTEVLQSGLTIVEYAPFSSYLPRLPQEALLCRRLWTSQPL